ncbi:MAG: manganese transport transcriptional regulator [Methanoregulaceae archaeon PtaB.Bin108]|nr:MAG: manganese transport transcriptional regulator [Methanoregulaceae archaeon PtaB.Bin108]OPY41371.1 MAG: manganese transport transcriptional regulator [Methanoregulaceae archaeon PtaU1.Bin222]
MRYKTIEEYIETIYVLELKHGRAQTGMIAARMGVKPPSITEMLGKLEREGLIRYESYTGATLTVAGKKMARELMHTHKVIADLLEILGIDRTLAEADACQIEHHVSRETVARLEEFVKFAREDEEMTDSIRRFRVGMP